MNLQIMTRVAAKIKNGYKTQRKATAWCTQQVSVTVMLCISVYGNVYVIFCGSAAPDAPQVNQIPFVIEIYIFFYIVSDSFYYLPFFGMFSFFSCFSIIDFSSFHFFFTFNSITK